jgi:hypothetical protein
LLDVSKSNELFDFFARNGKTSILLDGYDEIDPDQVQQITASIEDLAARYPESRILVTSRPQSGIENSSYFDVIPIAKLEKHDFEPFFEKILGKDKILAKRLCTAINNSNFAIGALVSTPSSRLCSPSCTGLIRKFRLISPSFMTNCFKFCLFGMIAPSLATKENARQISVIERCNKFLKLSASKLKVDV